MIALPRPVAFIVFLDHLAQRLVDLDGLERLEQVVLDAEADGFLRVVEMAVAADDDEIDLGVEPLGAVDQFACTRDDRGCRLAGLVRADLLVQRQAVREQRSEMVQESGHAFSPAVSLGSRPGTA